MGSWGHGQFGHHGERDRKLSLKEGGKATEGEIEFRSNFKKI